MTRHILITVRIAQTTLQGASNIFFADFNQEEFVKLFYDKGIKSVTRIGGNANDNYVYITYEAVKETEDPITVIYRGQKFVLK